MSIAAYITLTRDDTEVCENAIRSVEPICDEILLVDTGEAVLRRNVRTYLPDVREFQSLMCDKGYPVVYTHCDWGTGGDHAQARNLAGQLLAKHDWVLAIDSDEMLTLELAACYGDLDLTLGAETVTVRTNLLTLYPDERHYSPRYSQILSHGRFYRPKAVTWVNPWHEHQNYRGKRLDLADYYHLHFRQLWRNRCYRQHGHWPEAWPGITEDVREITCLAATWLPIIYPTEDAPVST